MTTIAKTTRLPRELLYSVEYRTKKENIDESAALRQLLTLGIQRYAVQLYKQGQVTLREAAKLCSVTLREMIEILLDHGVKGNINYDMQKKSLEIIKSL
ncbi:hypothetical protein COV18_00765 [Candidatus Woesearchaeota archaeon CG10_big_fil_rev_8_21_14_0_10_37_12]|nr:MAG: hypothetical protein COV18_00765 [Candidatus Woesearchaeota archaeon CG10_big_fil_rev_8_21_14_0_10_37_12]